jgi:hypothetical protein
MREDGALFTIDWHAQSPYVVLIVGLMSFSAAVVWTVTGRAWIRFHGWVYRAKEPRRFWLEVVVYYLGGVGLLGYFLYLVK